MLPPSESAVHKAAEAAVLTCDAAALRKALATAPGSLEREQSPRNVERRDADHRLEHKLHEEVTVTAAASTALAVAAAVQKQGAYGFSLLHAACSLPDAQSSAQLEIVMTLLDKGAHVNAVDSGLGYTALHWACTGNNPDLVRLLLARGADLTMETFHNQSCLDLAIAHHQAAILHVLLTHQLEASHNCKDVHVRESDASADLLRVLRTDLDPLVPARMLEQGRHYTSRKWRDRFVGLNRVADAIAIWRDAQAGDLAVHVFASDILCIRTYFRGQVGARIDLYRSASPWRLSLMFASPDLARHFAGQCRNMAHVHCTIAAVAIQTLWRGLRGRRELTFARSQRAQTILVDSYNDGPIIARPPNRMNEEPGLARHTSAPQSSSARMTRTNSRNTSPRGPLGPPSSPSLGLSRLKSFSRMRRMVSFGSTRSDSDKSPSRGFSLARAETSGPQVVATNSPRSHADDLREPALLNTSLSASRGSDSDSFQVDEDTSSQVFQDLSEDVSSDQDLMMRAVLQVRAKRVSRVKNFVTGTPATKHVQKVQLVEASRKRGGLTIWKGAVPLERASGQTFVPFGNLLDARLALARGKDQEDEGRIFAIYRSGDGEIIHLVASSPDEAQAWVSFVRELIPREHRAVLLLQTHARGLLARQRVSRLRLVRRRSSSHRAPPPLPEPDMAPDMTPCEVWESALDAATNRVYLFKGPDRRATWAPKEWVKSKDPKRQLFFYCNTLTHTSQWTPPVEAPRAIESAVQAAHLGELLNVQVASLEAFAQLVLQDNTLIVQLAERVLPGLVQVPEDDLCDLEALRLAAWAAALYGAGPTSPSTLVFNENWIVRVSSSLLHVHNVRIIESYLALSSSKRQLDPFVKQAVQSPRSDVSLLRSIHTQVCDAAPLRWPDIAEQLGAMGCRLYPMQLEIVQSQTYCSRVAVCAWILVAKYPELAGPDKPGNVGRRDEMHAIRAWLNSLDKFRLAQVGAFTNLRDQDSATLARVCESLFGASASRVTSRAEVVKLLVAKRLWTKQSFPSPPPSLEFSLPTLWALLDAGARLSATPEDPVIIQWANARLPAASNVVSFEDPVHKTCLPVLHLAQARCGYDVDSVQISSSNRPHLTAKQAAVLALNTSARAGLFVLVPPKLLSAGNPFAVHIFFVHHYKRSLSVTSKRS